MDTAASVMDAFRTRTEDRLAVRWEDLDVPTLARSMVADLLVLHDRGDREVPWTDGLAVAAAWPRARLVSTAGLGHHRILRDPEVVARAVAFLAGEDAAAPAPGWPEPCATPGCLRPAAECGPHCLACAFERELYAPATRARMQTMPAV